MTRQSFANCLKWGSVALLLAGVLFAGGAVSQSGGLVGSVFREVSAVCRDDSTQWMLAVCLAVYLVFFCFLERRAGAGFNFKARHLTPARSLNLVGADVRRLHPTIAGGS